MARKRIFTEQHPLGFRKYVLFSFAGYRLRLHVWPKGDGHEGAHNHRWWFLSIPLLGRFVDTRYREVDGGDLMKINILDRDGVRDGDREYHLQGISGLVEIARKIRYPFLPYICRIGAIHSYVPAGKGRHASLVLVSPLRTKSAETWRAPDAIDMDME